jgi:lysylphosphatidylglycerol synthetase-like protein (DUF2156 family)
MIFQFAGTGPFSRAVYYLQQFELMDVLIPFALIASVTYFVAAKMFGDKKNIAIVFTLSVTLLAVVPHVLRLYPSGWDVITIINTSAPQVILIIIAIFLAMLLVGAFTRGTKFDLSFMTGNIPAWTALIIVLIVFAAAVYPSGLPVTLSFLADPAFYSTIIAVLVFGLIVWFITSGGETRPPSETTTTPADRGAGGRREGT